MSNDERDKIDSLLDDALASYSRQEPRPGLKQRVLDRVHTAAAPRLAFPQWVWTLPAAACLLGAGILWNRHVPTPKHSSVMHVTASRETAPPRPEAPRIVNRSRKRKLQPRLPQFPAPAPITHQERALLAFVAHAPKEVQEALMDVGQGSIEPIRIEEIKIQPLQ